ncbi:MAG TPA: sugar phosphate isomerase/epimerase [Anaerolineae bacterium]|nr:sugar phosphate isomerase/epimerase [Anaerolineae bacterium]
MRFGIMTLQLQSLIPSDSSAEQVISHLAGLDYAKLVRSLVEAGFKNIEIGGDMALFFPHTLQAPSIEALAALQSELDLTYSVHLPLWSLEPSTPYEPVRSASVQVMADIIRATLPLEPEVYVMHATGALAAEFYRMTLPDMAKAMVVRQFQSYAEESLASLLKKTGIHSRRIAIETIEFPFDLTLELAESLDLSICLDTGHVLVGFSGPVTIDQVLDQSGSRLAEVHLHDGPWQGPERKIGYGLDHKPLGMGDLDVGSLLDRLQAMAFDGPIIFELQLHEAIQSLEVVRKLRPEYLA